MQEVKVVVILQVDANDPNEHFSRKIMRQAAVEAVNNALKQADQDGFVHSQAEKLSIGFVEAD